MKNPLDLHWSGPLTTNNVEYVADLLRQLLTNKRFTFIEVHEGHGSKPKIHTGKHLEEWQKGSSAIRVSKTPWFASVTFYASDTAWPLATDLAGEAQYNPKNHIYFWFEGDKVKIALCNDRGQKIYWAFAVEHPNRR